MALMVEEVFLGLDKKYGLRLLAGKEGLKDYAQWANTVEDDKIQSYQISDEIVFTAGLKADSENWLYSYVVNINKANVRAVVVKLGGGIKKISEEVVDFCNENSIPLYSLPEDVLMVQVSKEINHKLVVSDNEENNIVEATQNVIFNIGDLNRNEAKLERYGILNNNYNCFVIIEAERNENDIVELRMKDIQYFSERIAKTLGLKHVSFYYHNKLVLILTDDTLIECEKYIKEFYKSKTVKFQSKKICLGISPVSQGFTSFSENFKKALHAVKIGNKLKTEVMFYDDINLHKLLLEIKDKKVIAEFYEEFLGKLKHFDEKYETDLYSFVIIYLENDGNVQVVSEKCFIHRNTVNNQLKKIKKITGYNLLELEVKVKFYLAMKIAEILEN